MKVLLVLAVTLVIASALPSPLTTHCYHREDRVDHKCYEGCAPLDFKSKGLTQTGSCNTGIFKIVETTKVVPSCSDGKTNLKYCHGGGLYPVNITFRIKGEAFGAEAPVKCGTGDVVSTLLVRSHAIEAAKVDWCISNSTAGRNQDICTQCLDPMPAQPGNVSIAIGADVDYFVFSFKKSEEGKEAELYPDFTSGDWPESYNLQDPPQLSEVAPAANCKTDADCPCSYCMDDASKKPPYLCHAPTPGVCCKTDKDCPNSYCVNYHGPPPYRCHGSLQAPAKTPFAAPLAGCKTGADCQKGGDMGGYCKANGDCHCSAPFFGSDGSTCQLTCTPTSKPPCCRDNNDCTKDGDKAAYCKSPKSNLHTTPGNGMCRCGTGFKGTTSCHKA